MKENKRGRSQHIADQLADTGRWLVAEMPNHSYQA